MKKFIEKPFFYCLTLCSFIVVAFFLAQYIIAIPASLILGASVQKTTWLAIIEALIYILFFALLVFVLPKFFRYLKTSREELGLNNWPTWTDLGLAIVGFLVYLFSSTLLTQIFSFLPFFDANEAQNTGFTNLYNLGDRILVFFLLCILAPILEELIFRGWLYGKLRTKLSSKFSVTISIFITSILFAFLHNQFNVGVDVFALSVVLCILREITGTTYSGIIIHILKNSIAFYLLFVFL